MQLHLVHSLSSAVSSKFDREPVCVNKLLFLLYATNIVNATIKSFLEGKKKRIEEKLERAHVTLAHKRSHGVAAVARYGEHLNREVPVELTELIFNDKMAAFTAHVGSVDGETIVSKNEWPYVTLWTGLQKALLQRRLTLCLSFMQTTRR